VNHRDDAVATTAEDGNVPGVNGPKVEQWMASLSIAPQRPITFELAGEGKSNITLIATAADGQRWVLRRPPLGKLLPTAHDVAREYRILSALQGTAVPVPRPVALTSDAEIVDAPLMVMEYVDGLVIDSMPKAEGLAPDLRGAVGRALVQALAAVHAVDLGATGLIDLASHRPFAARQLKRWRTQWEESRTREADRIDSLAERLTAAAPEREELVLVHGDYHLRNAIVDRASGRVDALLDWELSTLGDPLADLGLLLAYWPEPEDPPGQPFPASALPGFPRREELVSIYADSTGRDMGAVGFWEVLGLWKVAVILEGVRRRALDEPRNADRGASIDPATIDAVIDRAWLRADALGI
jgi:aminoglycoside phosphotransferase (APT) family kinase protein